MAYSDLEAVKDRLNITHDKEDERLTRCLTQASNWIDRQLKPYTSTPIGSPPQDLIDAEADIAAGLYREETAGRPSGPVSMPNVLRGRGEAAVRDYIKAFYLGPVERKGYFRHVKSHSSHSEDHGSR